MTTETKQRYEVEVDETYVRTTTIVVEVDDEELVEETAVDFVHEHADALDWRTGKEGGMELTAKPTDRPVSRPQHHALENAKAIAAQLDQAGRLLALIDAGPYEPDEDEDDSADYEEMRRLAAELCIGDPDDGPPTDEQVHDYLHEYGLSFELTATYRPGELPDEPDGFDWLISTGGPAARIIGSYSGYDAVGVRVQHQDWFKPWTDGPPLTHYAVQAVKVVAQAMRDL